MTIAVPLCLVMSVPVTPLSLGLIHSPADHLLLVILLQVGPVDLHGQVVDPGPGQGAQVTRDHRHDPPDIRVEASERRTGLTSDCIQ